MKRCNLAPEVRNGVGIIHIFRGQEADTGRPRADAPVNELFQVCTEAVSISEVQIRRERERETSVLEDLHETGGSLFMFLMSFRFFTWNLALRLDTIKRWEKNLSVVSEADSRELCALGISSCSGARASRSRFLTPGWYFSGARLRCFP